MEINPVRLTDGLKKPEKGKVNKLPEAGNRSFQDELRFSLLISSIKSEMADGKTEAAFSAFKTIFTSPGGMLDLARRVFEGAPIFAALVAKMAVDEIMKKFDLEKEKARELKTLVEKYSQETKKVLPI